VIAARRLGLVEDVVDGGQVLPEPPSSLADLYWQKKVATFAF